MAPANEFEKQQSVICRSSTQTPRHPRDEVDEADPDVIHVLLDDDTDCPDEEATLQALALLVMRLLVNLSGAIAQRRSACIDTMSTPASPTSAHGPLPAKQTISKVDINGLSHANGLIAHIVTSYLGGDGHYMERFVLGAATLLPSFDSLKTFVALLPVPSERIWLNVMGSTQNLPPGGFQMGHRFNTTGHWRSLARDAGGLVTILYKTRAETDLADVVITGVLLVEGRVIDLASIEAALRSLGVRVGWCEERPTAAEEKLGVKANIETVEDDSQRRYLA